MPPPITKAPGSLLTALVVITYEGPQYFAKGRITAINQASGNQTVMPFASFVNLSPSNVALVLPAQNILGVTPSEPGIYDIVIDVMDTSATGVIASAIFHSIYQV